MKKKSRKSQSKVKNEKFRTTGKETLRLKKNRMK